MELKPNFVQIHKSHLAKILQLAESLKQSPNHYLYDKEWLKPLHELRQHVRKFNGEVLASYELTPTEYKAFFQKSHGEQKIINRREVLKQLRIYYRNIGGTITLTWNGIARKGKIVGRPTNYKGSLCVLVALEPRNFHPEGLPRTSDKGVEVVPVYFSIIESFTHALPKQA